MRFDFRKRDQGWVRWFAWYPVKVEYNVWVWMEYVWRIQDSCWPLSCSTHKSLETI